MVFINIVT